MGLTIPLIAYMSLTRLVKLDKINSSAIAAHYGSVSLVAFGAAVALFEQIREPTSGFMPAVLALMEAPAIAVGVALARRAGSSGDTSGHAIRDAVTTGSVLVLLGATAIGLILGAQGLQDLDGFFVAPFTGVLALFLLDMGLLAFSRIGALKEAGVRPIIFAIAMPLVGGFIGVLLGTVIGLGVGDTALLATLAASASYIAAPAAMRVAVPEANPGLSLPLAIGITFPFNLIVGVPLYLQLSKWLVGG